MRVATAVRASKAFNRGQFDLMRQFAFFKVDEDRPEHLKDLRDIVYMPFFPFTAKMPFHSAQSFRAAHVIIESWFKIKCSELSNPDYSISAIIQDKKVGYHRGC